MMHAENLHFRCIFTIKGSEEHSWNEVPKVLRAWISRRVAPNDAFWSRWFFAGGQWTYGADIVVRTLATEAAEGEDPEFWALSFTHVDKDFRPRRWRTDVGLTRKGANEYLFSLALSHSLVPGYIGESPAPPLPSAPRVVTSLLEHPAWSARAGSEVLTSVPQVLSTGDGKLWVERLTDGARTCPLVFVSRDLGGKRSVDPARLARLLAGVAVVVEEGVGTVDQELQWVLPKTLRCWNGAVRVYLPGVGMSEDGLRHRYFSADRIEQIGPAVFEDALVEALARRSPVVVSGVTTTIQDVETRQREARLAALRHDSKDAGELREWAELVEKDNAALNQKLDQLMADSTRLQDQLEIVAAQKEEEADRARVANSEVARERERAIQAEGRVRQLDRALVAFRELKGFPRDVRRVAELASQVFPERLVFTERALKSAEGAAINDAPGEMDNVWHCLQSMATVLHDLHFPPPGVDPEAGTIKQGFDNKTAFVLGVTEGSQTKGDAKLMKLRKGTYKGEEIDVASHVKYDAGKRFLRVHYYAHPVERVLVVDHCGDHLDTAGTRRRK